jgi:hypothetical protein
VKVNNTESSFNDQVQNIMDSELSSRYAFIEHRQAFNEEIIENRINDIECNKYTIEEFKKKSEILTNRKAWYVEEEGDYMEFFNYWKTYKNNYQKTVTKKQPKIFNIDINKCRKNELYYSKYDFPSFTVMDKVEPYDKHKPLTTGKYIVESKQYFPMR